MEHWTVERPKGTVVIVHGAGEHYRRYEWLAKKWNSYSFNVVMGDLPGHGKSRSRRGHIDTFDEYLDTVEQWLNEAKASGVPIVLFGHSMGGLIVIRMLMERQIRSIRSVILSSPCLGLYEPPARPKQLTAKFIHRLAPTLKANSRIRVDDVTRNESIRELYRKDDLRVTKVSIRWYQELTKAMQQSHRYPEKFPNIPLLVMQAGEDLIVNKDAVTAWFNDVHLSEKYYKEWTGLYHEIFNEPERERVFRHALSFANLHFHEFEK